MPSQAERADQIGEEVTAAVAAALGGTWTGAALLEAVLQLWPELAAKATAEQVIHALHVLGFVDSVHRALVDALTGPVEDAYAAGVEYAADTQGVPQTFDPKDALRLGGLQHALDQLGIELEGVSRTSVDQIGNVLAQAIADGVGSAVAARRIEPMLHDPARAEVIARTEIARAREGAALAQAQSMGGVDKSWSDAPGACPICQANTAEGVIGIDQPFQGGAMNPPQHPMCRCALSIVPSPISATPDGAP